MSRTAASIQESSPQGQYIPVIGHAQLTLTELGRLITMGMERMSDISQSNTKWPRGSIHLDR